MAKKADIENPYIPEFEKYLRTPEPSVRERADYWRTAIGLQAVDQLTVSDFLKQTAQEHIEGQISADEAEQRIKAYYQAKEIRLPDDDEKEEADKVAMNITKLLSEQSFTFSVAGLASIHRQIFKGVFKHAGQFRDYDITKKEWVLNGDTVLYASSTQLQATLEYDLEQEKQFDYSNLALPDAIRHIAAFVANIWQIHPFREGNTRTTAVFTIKYLRSIGFQNIDNTLFEQHSWFFRNALVRANYKNARLGVNNSPQYLERFFRNLLLGEQMPLHNRDLHISNKDVQNAETEQAPYKHRTSTEQVQDKFETSNLISTGNQIYTDDENTIRLVQAMRGEKLSIKEIMSKIELKHRPTFMENYLNPAIENGFVRLLYPDSPRHPRQKYLLTVKGMMLLNQLSNK
ncbi:MAG: Fic family protein [Paludibacteraceae bacterium]|nr:Fic family protein [Paludibacteraceae bacterium]